MTGNLLREPASSILSQSRRPSAEGLGLQSGALDLFGVLAGQDRSGENFDVATFPPIGSTVRTRRNHAAINKWAATLIFEFEMRAGVDLQRTPFALPDCLRLENGAFRAEITATLACESALDGTFGAEYCRTNVDLSLGTYLLDEENDRNHSRQISPFPKREANAKEKKLVENGFKWSPVKVYRRSISRGVQGDQWRLAVMATDRSGAQNVPTRVAMIITIADIERREPVYNDVVVAMNRLGWHTADVTLKVAPRVRV